MPKPSIFVSSTCFDLGEVRDELSRFIEREIGYDAILSEHGSFPVNPDRTTVQNSQLAVKNNADLLVLLIGGRYGSIDPGSEKSITNSEYVEATAKGIPIYVFIHKAIETLYPAWEVSPENFSHPFVQSNRVFEFVRDIKATSRWVFYFEKATDIIDTLRLQWANLQFEGLQIRGLLAPTNEMRRLGLSGEALDVSIRRQGYWEFRLFIQLLKDEIRSRSDLRRDLDLRFVLRYEDHLDSMTEVVEWFRRHIASAQLISGNFNAILQEVTDAFAKPGQAGDAARITYACSRLGRIYESALGWALDLHRVNIPDEAKDLLEVASHMLDEIVESFEAFVQEFEETVIAAETGRASGTVVMTWTLAIPDSVVEQYNSEIVRLHSLLGL